MPTDIQQLTERYVLGKMSSDEAADFEALIQNDDDMRQQYEEHRILVQGAALRGKQLMKDRLRVIESRVNRSNKSRQSKGGWIVAILILGVLLLLAFFYFAKRPSTDELFNSIDRTYVWNGGTRDFADDKLIEWQQMYRDKRFQELLPILQKQSEQTPENGRLRLVVGICQMETGKLSDAREVFSSLIATENPRFSDLAKWYTALTFLQEDKIEQTKKYLQELADDPTADKHRDALDLLKNINHDN
ncbi:MAG: hypothetical protein AAF990_22150 [Bacteroidota bacterium]